MTAEKQEVMVNDHQMQQVFHIFYLTLWSRNDIS